MNNIDRRLVKSQAKELIKGKVFPLFLVIFIVSVLSGGASGGISFIQSFNDDSQYSDYNFDKNNGYSESDENYFNNFNFENPIENFEYNAEDSIESGIKKLSPANIKVNFSSGIITVVFIPLYITMSGLFVAFIRRNTSDAFRLDTMLENLFKNSFSRNYFKKLLAGILRAVICGLLMIVFIIPGIIAYYSTYFTYQIMCDYPNLSSTEALKLSKKMVKGNRTELFVMNLSFIGWCLLYPITLGLIGIYVEPYFHTTNALYYENFRIRAIENGVLTNDDFLSADEKAAKYYNSANYSQNGYNTYSNGYSNGSTVNNQTSYQTPPYQQNRQNTAQNYSYNPNRYSQSEGRGYYYEKPETDNPDENVTQTDNQNDNI